MSVVVNLSSLSLEEKKQYSDDLTVVSKPDFMGYGKAVEIYPFIVEEENLFVPFYYGNQKLKKYPNDQKKFTKQELKWTGNLRDYQQKVIDEAVTRLNKVRCVFLAMATGKGKTHTSIYLSTLLKVKTCVLCHRLNIQDQWVESIKKLLPGVVIQCLGARDPIDSRAHFYIINPITVLKRTREDFADVGFLIADEAHVLCSEKMSQSLLHFRPKWCIGLSATPDKDDGLDKILHHHFGFYQILIPLRVEHDYFRFDTQLVVPVKKNQKGDTDWHSVLEFQALSPERNQWIAQICEFFEERNILVLCKRKEQVKILYELLQERGSSVEWYCGTRRKYDKEARVLVATTSKAGVGFDHPKIDMLVIASDVEALFIQYFGRCVRREDVRPIVVDLVDKLKSLENHFRTRKNYAVEIGGKIRDFRMSYPQFFLPRKEGEVEIIFE
jgi:superfamily II DNA or RNA helicase